MFVYASHYVSFEPRSMALLMVVVRIISLFLLLFPTRLRRDDRLRERLCWTMERAKSASQPLGVSL